MCNDGRLAAVEVSRDLLATLGFTFAPVKLLKIR